MREMTPEMLAQVAELFYRHGKSREWIAKEFSKELDKGFPYAPSSVNRWVREAGNHQIVAFDIDPSFGLVGERNGTMESGLNDKDTFGLEAPIVVDIPVWVDSKGRPQEDPKADALHMALANHTGIRLSQIPSDRTRFLVGGGRTVVQVARMIKRRGVLWSDIRVDALSGRIWTDTWQVDGPDFRRPLDADDAARILASACRTGASFSQIWHPIYAESIDQAHAIMREHSAFKQDGSWSTPNRAVRAICGIGSLQFSGGHRIMGFLESYLSVHGISQEDLMRMIQNGTLGDLDLPKRPDPSAPYLSRVALELITAISFAAQHNLGYFGDIANRLFPCLPLPQNLNPEKLPKIGDFANLLKKLDALNRRAIVMQWSHLRQASTWVVAGGPHKLGPIWTLAITRYIERQLRNSPNRDVSIMNHLTTDSYTAAKMMEALEAFKGSMPEVKKWYRDLTEILFQDDPIDAGGGKTYRVAQSTTSRRRTETPVASTKGGQPDEDGNASVPASKIGPMEELRISPSLRVFMCHASDDKPAVRELYERLKRASIDPWLDAEDILAGQAWRYEIEKAVRSTHIVLVCLSKRSASKTGFVNREIRIALDVADQQPEGTIFVIPLKLEECDVPDRLRQWQWVNLYEEKGFEKLMRALLERARSVGIRLEQYTPP